VGPIDDPSNIRSRRTRAGLLAAARAIIEESGFELLTMAEVARRAGVSRRAVYLHFPSRTDLVSALFDHVAATERLEDSTRPVWDAADGAAALDEWAKHLGRYHPRLIPLARAMDLVYRTDPDAGRHRERVFRAQRANCERLVERLEAEGRLASPWTAESAVDMLWALISTDMIERLLVDRAWSPERFAKYFGALLRATFVRDPQNS
jgi:AcrR family transcriptional regulator